MLFHIFKCKYFIQIPVQGKPNSLGEKNRLGSNDKKTEFKSILGFNLGTIYLNLYPTIRLHISSYKNWFAHIILQTTK